MTIFDDWLSTPSAFDEVIDPAEKAVERWGRIQRKPQQITITRNGIEQPAQTVRLTYPGKSQETIEPGMRSEKLTVRIVGVKDHPDPDIPDSDLQQGDLFYLNDLEYEIRAVTPTPGGLQALADAK